MSQLRRPSAEPAAVDAGVKSQGRPLDHSTRAFFESRFGHDFSRVRIHSDSEAANSAASLNASAYTVGNDVVFGSGGVDRTTLAHELAHVVQQSRGGGAPAPLPGSSLEQSAERAASDLILGNRSVRVHGSSGPGLARVFAPNSLDRQLDPSTMSEPEIHREIELITHWLKDNPNGPESSRLAANLGKLQVELGRRPAPAAKGLTGGASGGRASAELRFPIPLVKQPAPPSVALPSNSEPSSINRRPPETKSPSIESLLPAPRETRSTDPLERDLLGPTGAETPAKTTPESPPAPQTQTPKPKADDDKPGLGLQTGSGTQTGIRAPHQAFQYVQVSAEFSNAFALSLKDDQLPAFLKGKLESISFLGEPGWTLQYHVAGDQTQTLDLQFLLKLIQVSLKGVDISLVGGEQFADLGKKWDSSRFTPLLGVESETKILGKGPVSLTWVLDGLAALPQKQTAPDILGHTEPRAGRWFDAQFSGELRLKLLWDIGVGKSPGH